MNVRDLEPGTFIQFDDLLQVSHFEDMVADELDPRMSGTLQDAWDMRLPFKTLIRPKGFNGTITAPAVIVMDEPYERYVDAKARGKKFNKGGHSIPKSDDSQQVKDSYKGYIFTADALSTACRTKQIQAEFWLTSQSLQKYTRSNIAHKGESSVRRMVTLPVLESDRRIAPAESARQIGFSALLLA